MKLAAAIAGGIIGMSGMTASQATDAVGPGLVSSLAYRGGYILFALVNGSVNYCQPCPSDPSGMASGGYCWIAEAQKTQVAMLLAAQAQGVMLLGRVNALSSDCTMYQTQMAN